MKVVDNFLKLGKLRKNSSVLRILSMNFNWFSNSVPWMPYGFLLDVLRLPLIPHPSKPGSLYFCLLNVLYQYLNIKIPLKKEIICIRNFLKASSLYSLVQIIFFGTYYMPGLGGTKIS